MSRLVVLVLLASLCSCSQTNRLTTENQAQSQDWSSIAKDYRFEGAYGIWRSTTYVHLRESDENGQLYDFVLKSGTDERLVTIQGKGSSILGLAL